MPLRLIVFAKAPVAGLAKTRLIPALGAEGAAQLAGALLRHTLQSARAALQQLGPQAGLELCGTPGPQDASWAGLDLPPGCLRTEQAAGDLGLRMERAFDAAMAQGEDVLLFGTDGPELDAARLVAAAQALARCNAVLQPVTDGGYLLLGLRASARGVKRSLFHEMPWSTDRVAALTLQRLHHLGLSVEVLPPIRDLDEPADLAALAAAGLLP